MIKSPAPPAYSAYSPSPYYSAAFDNNMATNYWQPSPMMTMASMHQHHYPAPTAASGYFPSAATAATAMMTTPAMPGTSDASACPFLNPLMTTPGVAAADPYYASSSSGRAVAVESDINMMANVVHGMYDGFNRALTPEMGNVNFRPSSAIEFMSMMSPVRLVDGAGDRMIWLAFDMAGYRPDEINVTLNKDERSISVEAGCEFKPPPPSSSTTTTKSTATVDVDDRHHQVSRRYCRKVMLPPSLKSVDLSRVELLSRLTSGGFLVVEGQLPRMAPQERDKYLASVSADFRAYMPFGNVPPNITPISCKITA